MIMMGMMTGGDGAPGDAHPEVIGRARMAVPLPPFRWGICHQWGGCPARGIRSGAWTTRPLPRIPGGAPSMRRGAGAARTGAGRGSHSPDRQGPCSRLPHRSAPSGAGARPDRPPCGGHRRAGSPRGPDRLHMQGAGMPIHHHRGRGIGTDVPGGPAARPLRPCGPPRAGTAMVRVPTGSRHHDGGHAHGGRRCRPDGHVMQRGRGDPAPDPRPQ